MSTVRTGEFFFKEQHIITLFFDFVNGLIVVKTGRVVTFLGVSIDSIIHLPKFGGKSKIAQKLVINYLYAR